MTTAAHLWAIGYDNMERADQVREEIARLGWESGPAATPSQVLDFVSDLIGPCHVVVPDGPEMRGCRHGRSSTWSSTAASVD